MTTIYSFDPISDRNARVLILGSMPGKVSLEAGQYYANPRNAFWRIMESILGIPSEGSYEERCAMLVEHGIALWDVLRACARPGSLDADIVESSIVPNDFQSFFELHRGIEAVYFNGAKAEHAYRRHVHPSLRGRAAGIDLTRLPSTSPAHAALYFEAKLAAWRVMVRNNE